MATALNFSSNRLTIQSVLACMMLCGSLACGAFKIRRSVECIHGAAFGVVVDQEAHNFWSMLNVSLSLVGEVNLPAKQSQEFLTWVLAGSIGRLNLLSIPIRGVQ